MNAFLPKRDPNESLRKEGLNSKRLRYEYNFTFIAPLAMLQKLPSEQFPSIKWLSLVAKTGLQLRNNTLAVKKKDNPNHTNLFEKFSTDLNELDSDRLNTDESKSEFLKLFSLLDSERIDNPGNNWAEYDSLFEAIAKPDISINQRFLDDSEFAWMRVAGSNPLVIEGISALDERFPVTEAHYKSVLPNDSLEAAGNEGRLFLADYAVLAEVITGKHPDKQKYLSAPLALFAVPPAESVSRDLVAIAIQCGQDPANNPILTPPRSTAPDSEKWAWKIAKTIVQIADANFHELISHLGLTHLFVEPFAIATERQLAAAHPLGILLRPHFEGTLSINDLAQKILTGEADPVDELLAGTFQASQHLAAQAIQKFDFNDNILPETFVKRKVQALPNYPYRDDALLIWDAIHQWVSEYLSIYYSNEGTDIDQEVEQDTELQEWVRELLSPNGGRINGIGQNGKIKTFAYLVDATTQIIFTASAQHAAVNFPQASLMSYAPVMPMAGYIPTPTNFETASSQTFFNLLPPIKQAQGQLDLTFLLGSVYYTKLGNYSTLNKDPKNKDKVDLAMNRFKAKLEEIETKIHHRNQAQPEKSYTPLLPSKIPQSINI